MEVSSGNGGFAAGFSGDACDSAGGGGEADGFSWLGCRAWISSAFKCWKFSAKAGMWESNLDERISRRGRWEGREGFVRGLTSVDCKPISEISSEKRWQRLATQKLMYDSNFSE